MFKCNKKYKSRLHKLVDITDAVVYNSVIVGLIYLSVVRHMIKKRGDHGR